MRIALVTYKQAVPHSGPIASVGHFTKMFKRMGHEVDHLFPNVKRNFAEMPNLSVSPALPEAEGMWQAGPWFEGVPWGDYDFIFNFEWAFVSLFYGYRIKSWLRVSVVPCCDDGTSVGLNPLVKMLYGVVAPTPETYGLFLGRGCQVVELTYPIDQEAYTLGTKTKDDEVIWVGRNNYGKNLPLLALIVGRLPQVKFRVFQSKGNAEAPTADNVHNHVGGSHGRCREVMARATVALLTTRWEVAPNFLVEAGLSGALPVFPRGYGLRHIPGKGVDVFGRSGETLAGLLSDEIRLVLSNPPDPEQVRQLFLPFSIPRAALRWEAFFQSLQSGYNLMPYLTTETRGVFL